MEQHCGVMEAGCPAGGSRASLSAVPEVDRCSLFHLLVPLIQWLIDAIARVCVCVCPLISLISLLLGDEPTRMYHSRREDGSIPAAS